ncbi:MAG: permease [Gemmataceae bacterium]|nr:permease [Gemmataceae bacterium]
MDPTLLDFLLTFSAILWEAMPFIVVGAVVAGVLEEFLPQQFITRILPPRLLPSVMVGAGLGLVFPMCECGIVVVMRRLLRKGLPLACCIAYLLAGPIINMVVIFSTWFAFRDHKIGPEMVGLRCGLGFLVAVVTALIVHGQYRKYGADLLTPLAHPGPPGKSQSSTSSASGSAPRRSLFQRLSHISATALHDFVDITVFLILGAVLAAVAKQYIAPDEVERLSREAPLLVIAGMMLLAALMCLCSEADAFVAASFTSLHISGKLAFLVYGPMVDIKLMMMYTRIFRPRLILIILVAVTTQVFLYTAIVHLIYQLNGWTGLPG